MIEALPQILPAEDDEISKFARADLNDKEFLSGSPQELRTPSTLPTDGLPRPSRAAGALEELAADAVLVAAGVQVNIDNLRLEELGVRLDRGSIAVHGYGRTTVSEATWSVPQCSRIEPNTNLCMRRGPSRDSDASR